MRDLTKPTFVGTGRGYYGQGDAYFPPLEDPTEDSPEVKTLKDRIAKLEAENREYRRIILSNKENVKHKSRNYKHYE
jgi:hypothetical protein